MVFPLYAFIVLFLGMTQHLLSENRRDQDLFISRLGYEVSNMLLELDAFTDFYAVIYTLLEVREECLRRGYAMPQLSDMVLSVPENLREEGDNVAQIAAIARRAYDFVQRIEQGFVNGGIQPIGLDIEPQDFTSIGPEMSENGAISFCWGLAGTLLLVVPHPVTQILGGCMIGRAIEGVWEELQAKAAIRTHEILLPAGEQNNRSKRLLI